MSQGNVDPNAYCLGCRQFIPVLQIPSHLCPNRPLELVLTAKGRRVAEGRRRH